MSYRAMRRKRCVTKLCTLTHVPAAPWPKGVRLQLSCKVFYPPLPTLDAYIRSVSVPTLAQQMRQKSRPADWIRDRQHPQSRVCKRKIVRLERLS